MRAVLSASRAASAGLLGMKVLARGGNTDDVNVVDEGADLTYYTYSGGYYVNSTGGLNKLYPQGTGWLLERTTGLYFEFDEPGRLIGRARPEQQRPLLRLRRQRAPPVGPQPRDGAVGLLRDRRLRSCYLGQGLGRAGDDAHLRRGRPHEQGRGPQRSA